MDLFVRIYMRVCKKERKYTWQKNARISCSRNDCKYTWEKTARISCHNLEMTVMSEELLLNSKYIKMAREERGFQAYLTQPPLVIVCHAI